MNNTFHNSHSKPQILVTDSLFIFGEHEEKMRDAGFDVIRLDKPNASEAELVQAVKGRAGYLLGGIEQLTDRVINAADSLKAISFTGTAWQEHIPDRQAANRKGIGISNTPHSNSQAVAEWILTAGLAMVRNLFSLGRTGNATFMTTPGFEELSVGIVGLGHVGSSTADLFDGIKVKKVAYWSRSPKKTKYHKKELDELLATSDIVCFCVSAEAGDGYINSEKLSKMKDGAIVTASCESCVDQAALLAELKSRRLRAYLDFTPKSKEFMKLPLETFYCSNIKTSYNTSQANKLTSDMATKSLLNILAKGRDKYLVNPESKSTRFMTQQI